MYFVCFKHFFFKHLNLYTHYRKKSADWKWNQYQVNAWLSFLYHFHFGWVWLGFHIKELIEFQMVFLTFLERGSQRPNPVIPIFVDNSGGWTDKVEEASREWLSCIVRMIVLPSPSKSRRTMYFTSTTLQL